MKTVFGLIAAFFSVVIFTACAKDDSGSPSKIKFDNKPSVIDVLKGKTKAEVLKMKYKELKASCSLKTEKITRDQLSVFSADVTPNPDEPAQPITNPNPASVIYDLKLQQVADKDLTQEVNSQIIADLDGKTLKLDITFKPLIFQEALNVDLNNKKYIMKHTPLLSYTAIYELVQDGSAVLGHTQASIYEKIENQQNSITAVKVGLDRYNFILECVLNRTINDENKDLQTEFESQWTVIDK